MAAPNQLSFAEARPRTRQRPRTSLTVLPDAARAEERLVVVARAGGLAARVACTVAELEDALVQQAQRAGRCPRIAPPLALPLAHRQAAREDMPRGSPFFAIRAEPGFASALQDLGAALAQGLLEPDELWRLCPSLPDSSRARVEPLARVLLGVRARLQRAGLCDKPTALRFALEALRTGLALPPLLANTCELIFEATLDWAPLRLELCFALAERLAETGARVVVRLPIFPGRPELTAALDPAASAFEARGGHGPAPELEHVHTGEDSPLAPFLSRLFGRRGPPLPDEARSPVFLRSCASPSAQAREVAHRCADLLDQGAAPDAIAVAVRSLGGGVAEELGAALERAQIPWRERRGRSALPAPPVQLALGLLDLAERNFPREELGALLASPLLHLREEGEKAWPQDVVRVLREARARDDASYPGRAGSGGGTGPDPDSGGVRAAQGAIDAQLGALSARLHARAADESDEHKRASRLRDAAQVEEVRARAARAMAAIRALPERAPLRAHAAALLQLLARWRLPQRLRRPGDYSLQSDEARPDEPATDQPDRPRASPIGAVSALARAAEAARARDQSALEALENACEGLARGAEALGRGAEPFARAEWAQLLAAALADASLRPGGARGGAVQLVELRELPGRSFDHVLICGLLDGVLPARPAPDPLLADEDRWAINRAAHRAVFRAPAEGDALLPSPRQAEELLLFQLGLSAARRSVGLFWPRADARGREALRSPFADEALRALGLPLREGADLQARLSPVPQLRDCRTSGDLLARAALEAFAEPAWRVSPPIPAAEARALAAQVAGSPLQARFRRIARAALAERERLSAFIAERPLGRFSGQLSGAALEAATRSFRFGAESPLSSRQLEENALCGFRTLGNRLLRLEEDEEPADELQIRERGTLLHRCLDSFFRRLHQEGRLPLRGGPARAAQLRTLAEVSEGEMERFARTEPVGHRALWELRRRELHSTLAAVIDAEVEEQSRPLEFEQRFGFAEHSWEPLALPAPDGGEPLLLRGAIDRIDEVQGGLLVLDYKSGGAQGLRRKLRAETLLLPEFQLAVYVATLRARNPGRPVDAAYLSIKDAERTQTLGEACRKNGVDLDALLELDPTRRAALREAAAAKAPLSDPARSGANAAGAKASPPTNLADAAWGQVARMRAGTLPVVPISCDYCQLKPVCRIVALPVDDEEGG